MRMLRTLIQYVTDELANLVTGKMIKGPLLEMQDVDLKEIEVTKRKPEDIIVRTVRKILFALATLDDDVHHIDHIYYRINLSCFLEVHFNNT